MTDLILESAPLGAPPWPCIDPFLFLVHHLDAYPAGDEAMAPVGSLAGRNLGSDFAGKDGWRMYHGSKIAGFPPHPHRGFETVTVLRAGYVDHSDSLGATARFGPGDAQWMTAGKGIVHSEMFPLLKKDAPNPLELFQIWVNLPARDKMVDPHFTMLWDAEIPRLTFRDEAGKATEVIVVAGEIDGRRAPAPPPNSWASRPEADVAILQIELEAGATWILPPAKNPEVQRTLYVFRGQSAKVTGKKFPSPTVLRVQPGAPLPLEGGPDGAQILVLQGRPIGEPVVAHGPFVMNKREEINQAIADYRRTQFGGWPWGSDEPVHPRDAGRFAKHLDGRVEKR